jgi:predicted NBD/HSP70 family sugar kinase
MAMGGRRQVLEAWPVETSTDRWETYPVEIELQRLTGLSVIRENDAHCAALGEYWTAGDSTRDFVTVYMAEGVGAGILIGGGIYRGSSGSAGEISHIEVDPEGPLCRCGRRGCLATVATPQALVPRIAADPRLAEACGVTPETSFGETYRRFCDAVHNGVPAVVKLFDTAANQLASVILDLVNTLDLDLVTLAGPGFTQLGEEYRSRIQRRLNESAYLREVHPITVRLGAGGADAAALGAASVVLHRNLTPHHSAP